MYLFFDTETSDLPNAGLDLGDPKQARIIQLACVLTDERFEEVASFSNLISIPPDTKINPKAQERHGISKDRCIKYGIPIQAAIHMYLTYQAMCEVVIGHSLKFDAQMLDIELKMCSMATIEQKPSICTMLAMTSICRLPNKWNNGYKWPKLQEAYQFCFGESFDKAHDALADVRATKRIFKWLQERERAA
jgi:DNA polymerase III subunit epsilon